MKAPLGVRVGQTASRQEGYETDVARGSQPGLHHCIAVVPPGTARMEIGPGVVRLGEAQLKEKKKKKGKAINDPLFSFLSPETQLHRNIPHFSPGSISGLSLSRPLHFCASVGAPCCSRTTPVGIACEKAGLRMAWKDLCLRVLAYS